VIDQLRYRLACLLFDLAAKVYPELACRRVSQAHHVGDRWLAWTLERGDA
jgi:hypothetical protein